MGAHHARRTVLSNLHDCYQMEMSISLTSDAKLKEATTDIASKVNTILNIF